MDAIQVFAPYTGPGRRRSPSGYERLDGICPVCHEDGYLAVSEVDGVGCNACGAHLASPGDYWVTVSRSVA